MARVLIVAYGNPLRSDDGLAWRAADELEGKFPADEVEIVRLHQLVPELAESISRSQLVIFLDAATPDSEKTKAGDIHVEQIHEKVSSQASGFCHAFSAGNVLGMAEQVYGARRDAYLVSMIGENFHHGESLSDCVLSSLPDFIARAEELIRNAGQSLNH